VPGFMARLMQYLRNATINEHTMRLSSPVGISPLLVPDSPKRFDSSLACFGRVLEYFWSDKPITRGEKNDTGSKMGTCQNDADNTQHSGCAAPGNVNHSDSKELSEEQKRQIEQEKKERSKKESIRRRRKKLSRIINLNFSEGSAFLTLTFKTDISIKQAERACQEFCKRMTRKHEEFAYVRILELQKSGRPHFHFLVKGLPSEVFHKNWYVFTKKSNETSGISFLSQDGNFKDTMRTCELFDSKSNASDIAYSEGAKVAHTSPLCRDWGEGFVEVHEIRTKDGGEVADVGAYMLKYLSKQDLELEGVTMYSFSRTRLKKEGTWMRGFLIDKGLRELWPALKSMCSNIRTYTGENPVLGKWKKTFIVMKKEVPLIEISHIFDYLTDFLQKQRGYPSICLPSSGEGLRNMVGATEAYRIERSALSV
jgi:hypothetical protein